MWSSLIQRQTNRITGKTNMCILSFVLKHTNFRRWFLWIPQEYVDGKSAEESPAGHGWCSQGDRSVRSDRSQLLLLSQDQPVRSLPGQGELFSKKSSNPKNDDETVVMIDKKGHSILWHQRISYLIWVKERDSMGVVTPIVWAHPSPLSLLCLWKTLWFPTIWYRPILYLIMHNTTGCFFN